MAIRIEVKSDLLQWACGRNGLGIAAFAQRFPHLNEWVRGEVKPTLKQLESFAKATHTPVGYLFLPRPPEEPIPISDFRTIASKSPVRPSPDLLDTIYICQQRQEWYHDYSRFIGNSPLNFVGSAKVESDVKGVAETIRNTLGFDLDARLKMPTWTDALRLFIEHADDAGIMVMCSGVVLNNNRRHLNSDEFRGFAMADDLAPLVFINGADTKAAQMFTLAHELAHIWLGQSAVSDAQPLITSDHKVERWCNQVAAELLVPLAILGAEFQKSATLGHEVDRLARRFKVSTLVILRRIYDLGEMTKMQFNEEYENELDRLRAIPKKSGGNFYLTQATRVSRRFARALVVSTLEGQTLHRDAFRLLGFSKLTTFHELGRNLGVL